MNPLLIGLGDLHYLPLSLPEKILFAGKVLRENTRPGMKVGVELCMSVETGQALLTPNTVELLRDLDLVSWHIDKVDPSGVDVLLRFAQRLPNLYGFVVHHGNVNLPGIPPELCPWLILENTDKRAPGGQTPREVCDLLDHLPGARFCLDVNHAKENGIPLDAFRLLAPKHFHVSDVNPSYLGGTSVLPPEYQTPHCLFTQTQECLPTNVAEFLKDFPESPLVLEGLVIPGGEDALAEEVRLVARGVSTHICEVLPTVVYYLS